MCSIYSSNIDQDNYDDINFLLKPRGPDNTSIERVSHGFTLIHNLLSITGEYTIQPFIEDDIACLYNGEIYNFKEFGDYKSDGLCLIDLYREYGEQFVRKLDGEFAIQIFDFKNNKILISSDIFRTKPLFYSIDYDKFGCSTFRTPLELSGHKNIKKMPPNTTKVFDLSSLDLIAEYPIYEFDLDQNKNYYDDWNIAFEKSISKRGSNTACEVFMGLSSGYDSGAICNELIRQSAPFKTYTVMGSEDEKVMSERFFILDSNEGCSYAKLDKTTDNLTRNYEHIKRYTDHFVYTIKSSRGYTDFIKLIDDAGSSWLSFVCEEAKKENRKIYLSGMGADEIFSDYGFNGKPKFRHSNFGGLFPKDLTTIFPWNSFYGSTMESYLAKEEYVAGAHGLEGRYPFLDKEVVQEFLNLSEDIKNYSYKSVLDNYLSKHEYPYEIGKKRGF